MADAVGYRHALDISQGLGGWLPDAAADLVLQQLDLCSLACLAVTCSSLRQAVLAYYTHATVRCTNPDILVSFNSWVGHHHTSLTNLCQCSIIGKRDLQQDISDLRCPQLCQLHLQVLKLQLGPAEGCPCVLHHCSGLTALHLHQCTCISAQCQMQPQPLQPSQLCQAYEASVWTMCMTSRN
jgi:hypothetical protein